jgi:hypothetical protein
MIEITLVVNLSSSEQDETTAISTESKSSEMFFSDFSQFSSFIFKNFIAKCNFFLGRYLKQSQKIRNWGQNLKKASPSLVSTRDHCLVLAFWSEVSSSHCRSFLAWMVFCHVIIDHAGFKGLWNELLSSWENISVFFGYNSFTVDWILQDKVLERRNNVIWKSCLFQFWNMKHWNRALKQWHYHWIFWKLPKTSTNVHLSQNTMYMNRN